MTGIMIEAKTPRGQDAIKKIISFDNEKNDSKWKMFFVETVERQDPFKILIEHKNSIARKMVGADHLISLTVKQLDSLGAINGVDYEVNRI